MNLRLNVVAVSFHAGERGERRAEVAAGFRQTDEGVAEVIVSAQPSRRKNAIQRCWMANEPADDLGMPSPR